MKYLKLVLLASLCMLAFGCTAAKQDSATTSASIEWRIKSLEESFLNFREEQRSQADQNAENAEEIKNRLDAIEGQVAVLKNGAPMADAPDDMAEPVEDKGWVTDLKPDDESWVDGQKPVPPKKMAESTEDKPWSQVPGAPVVIPEPKVVERSRQPQKTVAPKKMMMDSKAVYDAGLAKYQADDFDGARGAFDEFLKKYPKNDLTPNALYWKGETYYSQKDFAQAILTFKEVTGRFPKHHKSASALLKIGMSYEKVGDPDNAIFYLRALVEDFPQSDPAKLARKELNRLGG